MCARKNRLIDHFIFKKASITIYDKTKSFTLTELTWCALESRNSQLSNAHPVSSVGAKLFVLSQIVIDVFLKMKWSRSPFFRAHIQIVLTIPWKI